VSPIVFVLNDPLIDAAPTFAGQEDIELEWGARRDVAKYAGNFQVVLVVDTNGLIHGVFITAQRLTRSLGNQDIAAIVEYLFGSAGNERELKHFKELFTDVEASFTEALIVRCCKQVVATPVGDCHTNDVRVCRFQSLVGRQGNRRPGVYASVKMGINPHLVEPIGLGMEFIERHFIDHPYYNKHRTRNAEAKACDIDE